MRVRSLAPILRTALLAAALTAGAGTPSAYAAAGGKRPAAPRSAAQTLSGKTVNVSWKATSGRVEIAVRRPIGGRQRTTIRSTGAGKGKLAITLRDAAAPERTTVRVRVRRCTGSGRAKRCSGWTRWATPKAPTPAGGGNGTTGTSTTPTGGTSAPIGTLAPGTTTPVTTAAGEGPTIGGCPQMPSSWALNQRVDALPVAPKSNDYVRSMNGATKTLHPDFGSADLGAGPDGFGIPFRVVPESTAAVPVVFGGVDEDDIADYSDESDQGPYPIPLDTPIEGGAGAERTADRHVLVVQQGACKLWEMGNARTEGSHWRASGVYKFDLLTGAPRPVGWTSADAAGLPIEPLLARYDEVASGQIKHAIRMTTHGIANAYVPPASHFAPTSSDPDAPPMGQRFRLKASYDVNRLHGQAKVVAVAMQQYGLVLADTGSDWYVTGAPDRRWNDDDLNQLKDIPGSAFEAVDSAAIVRR